MTNPLDSEETADLYTQAHAFLRKNSRVPLTPGEEAWIIRRLVRQSLGIKFEA